MADPSLSGEKGRRAAAAGLIGLGLIGLSALSCGVFGSLAQNNPATKTAEAILVEQKLRQTMVVEEQQMTVQAATQAVLDTTATAEYALAQTATAEAEIAAAFEATEQAAAQATEIQAATATQAAAGLSADIQKYVKDGYLDTEQGTYYRLSDFEKSVAKINYRIWWRTKYSPKTFVVRADVAYESASTTANWYNAGCGFVFWDNGPVDHYRVLAALDGNVYAEAYVNNNRLELGKAFYGPPELPKGSYRLELIVNQQNSYVFVDGRMVKKSDIIARSKKEGGFSYTLGSGTNKDFGTRCTFTNVELWEVAE